MHGDSRDKFLALKGVVARAAKCILQSKGRICIVSHFDADGICAAAIMYHALELLGRDFELNFVRQIDSLTAESISKKDASLWIFLDIGSGQLEAMEPFFRDKKIVVCDHHPPENVSWARLIHANPFLAGIEGTRQVSGSGMAYLVARELTARAKSTVELAVVGACGDMQGMPGKMHGINRLLLESAELSGRISVDIGLRVFGRYTRPIHKALANSTEPYIKGITGDESRAVQVISSLDIPLKKHGKWRTISDLSKSEEKKLATLLIIENAFSGEDAREIVGKNFRLKNGFELRELASALNACGRLGEPLEGMKLALGMPNRAEELVSEYGRKIAKAIYWVNQNMDDFRKTENALYLVVGDNVAASMIGTIVSVVSKNSTVPVIFGLANEGGVVKVSARAEKDSGVDLDAVTREAAKAVGGAGGGHRAAAGARIPPGTEDAFIRACEKIFGMETSFV